MIKNTTVQLPEIPVVKIMKGSHYPTPNATAELAAKATSTCSKTRSIRLAAQKVNAPQRNVSYQAGWGKGGNREAQAACLLHRRRWRVPCRGTLRRRSHSLLLGAERLAGGLAQCTTLTYPGLGNNSIGPAGTESLARVLGQCKSLSRLHLLRNEIGPAGAGSLARMLPQCAALAHLNIWRNGIGDAGARLLAGVLAQCTVLSILDVSLNEIHTHEAERLRASCRGEAWCLRL